jgi:hypothetical protein
MSISMTLDDDIDVSRGDMIVRPNNQPEVTQDLEVMLCWLNNKPAQPRAKYTLMHTTNQQKAMIKEVLHKIDIQTLNRNSEDLELKMNDICKVKIRTTQPLMVDPYRENRTTGSLILIDDATNETVAASGKRYYTCFIPTSPNPTSGYVLILAEDQVYPTSFGVEEAMKVIMSGGMVAPEVIHTEKLQ